MSPKKKKISAEDYMAELGIKMRRERRRLGITQAELARAMGVSDATVSDYERGATMMSAQTREHLSQYFRREAANRVKAAPERPVTPFEELCQEARIL